MALVVITQDRSSIGNAIRAALAPLPVAELVTGKLVAIKPNETWASAEDISGVTQADTLQAVLQEVRRHGPREIVVTGGAGAAETDEVFRHAGLMDVIEQNGATFVDHNRPPFQEVALEYAPDQDVRGEQKKVMVNPRILEYETLVVVSQIKMHETATVTMALKNIAMSFPAADYYGHPRSTEKHRHAFFEDMHSFIAAMAKRFPIDLAINVGHPAMVGTGPLGGYTAETGLVIASTDALAADVIGARMLGFELQAVRHLWEAAHLGVGASEASEMEFSEMDLEAAYGAFTEAVYGRRLTLSNA